MKNVQSVIENLQVLPVGSILKVDAKTVYLQSFGFAGSKPLLFVSSTKMAAMNPDGRSEYIDLYNATIELPNVDIKPAIEKPIAPRRWDFADDLDGEDAYNEAYGIYYAAKLEYDKLMVVEPVKPVVPAKPANPATPVKAEPAKPAEPVEPTQPVSTNAPAFHYHLWPNPKSVNVASEYIPLVKAADSSVGTALDACYNFKKIGQVLGIDQYKLDTDNARRLIIRFLTPYGPVWAEKEEKSEPAKPVTVQPTKPVAPAKPATPVQPVNLQPTKPAQKPVEKPVEKLVEKPVELPNLNGLNSEDATTLLSLIAKLGGNKEQPVNNGLNVGQIAQMISDCVNEVVSPIVERMNELSNQIENAPKNRVEITHKGKVTATVDGHTHMIFPRLVQMAAIRRHVYLVGPAGSGKSTVAKQAATALNLNFYSLSVCAQTSKTELLGYMNATGQYVTTDFRRAYETGGIFLLDEIDNGNPNVLSVLNSALANGFCSFADGMIQKHADFVLIAAANTFGTGATLQYVGRNPIDAATLSRFKFLEMPYDEKFELQLTNNHQWTKFVQSVRAELKNERVVISPRASIYGVEDLAAGETPLQCVETYLMPGVDSAIKARILAIFNKFKF